MLIVLTKRIGKVCSIWICTNEFPTLFQVIYVMSYNYDSLLIYCLVICLCVQSNKTSVHFADKSEQVPDLSHFCPIWPTLEPNLASVPLARAARCVKQVIRWAPAESQFTPINYVVIIPIYFVVIIDVFPQDDGVGWMLYIFPCLV